MNPNDTTPSQTPLRIVSLEIENVKRLTAVHIEPDGATVVIGGDNAMGKSNVLDSITLALEGLGGETGKSTSRPVHGDAPKGKVVLDLGEIVVTRTFTKAGGSALTVAAANGAKFPSPQAMLDTMLGRISFDPLAFTRMKPADQLATLRDLCGINTTILDTGRANAFEERTGVNRKVKDLEAQVAGMPFHADAPGEEVSAAAITAELRAANVKNANRAEFILDGKRAAQSLAEATTAAATKRAEIVRLEQLITTEKARLADAETGIAERTRELDEMRAKAETMTEIDTAAISAKLDQVGALNRKRDDNIRRADAAAALKTWSDKATALTAKIEDFDTRKRAKLEAAKYPIAGLALADNGIKFNGMPFSQASSAEQLKVSVGIGLAMNPRLRVLLVRDGSLLDAASLAMLRTMAEEAQAQVWVEVVRKDAACSVVIEDGKVLEDRAK